MQASLQSRCDQHALFTFAARYLEMTDHATNLVALPR
jgi:hypothetical protein